MMQRNHHLSNCEECREVGNKYASSIRQTLSLSKKKKYKSQLQTSLVEEVEKNLNILCKQNASQIIITFTTFLSQLISEEKQNDQFQDKNENSENIKLSISREEKNILQHFFTLLAHYSTKKHYVNLAKLTSIISKIDVLSKKQMNYFFLLGIISFEQITQCDSLKQIIQIYRSIYTSGKMGDGSKNPFYVISQLIYLSKTNEDMDVQIVKEILQFPNFIQCVLKFRAKFPQKELPKSERDYSELNQAIVDNLLLKSLLQILISEKYSEITQKIFQVISSLMESQLSILMLKNLIKKMEISSEKNIKENWNMLFQLMQKSMRNFSTERKVLKFHKEQAYISLPLNRDIRAIKMKIKSYEFEKQSVICSLAGKKEQMLVSVRKGDLFYQLSFLKLRNSTACDLSKTEISWNSFSLHEIKWQFNGDKIKIEIINSDCKPCSIEFHFEAHSFIIGDYKYEMGAFAYEICQLTISDLKGVDINWIEQIQNQTKNKKKIEKKNCKIYVRHSFVTMIKALGDLDLFFLTISHIIKKISDSEALVQMIKSVMKFINQLVTLKKVKGKQLPVEEAEKRSSNILCLCWLIAHHKRGSAPILQLIELLNVRKTQTSEYLLNLLCNFLLWKDFTKQDHHAIVQKVDKLFIIGKKEENISIIKYCKVIIFDLVLFYSHIKCLSDSDKKLMLFKQAEILSLTYRSITNTNNQIQILQFIQFLGKIMYSLIDRTRQNQFSDMTIGLQVSILLVNIGQFLFKNRNKLHSGESVLQKQKVQILVNEICFWGEEIIECLESQILFIEGNQITYYDYVKKQYVYEGENNICQKCYLFVMYLINYTSQTLLKFTKREKIRSQCVQYFWRVAFIENNQQDSLAKILSECYIIEKLTNQSLIMQIFKKYLKIKIKINFPKTILNKIIINNQDELIKSFISQFQQTQEKTVVSEKMLQILVGIPQFFFTKIQKILLHFQKCQQIKKTLQFIENHLIIKEISSQVSQLLEKKKSKSSFLSMSSTQEQEEKNMTAPITLQRLISVLNNLQLLAHEIEIRKFYKIPPEDDATPFIENFHINLKIVSNAFTQRQNQKALQGVHFFIKKHIQPFSEMIIYDYIFPQKQKQIFVEKSRKKSFNIFQPDKIRAQSNQLFDEFLKERRKNLLKIEQYWNIVEKNNKYFWQIFISQDKKQQSIDCSGNKLKAKTLIKIDCEKRQIQLPKMVLSNSFKFSNSLDSDHELKNQQQSESSIFSDFKYYRKDSFSENSERESSPSKSCDSKIESTYHKTLKIENQISVLLITNTYIYQGTLKFNEKKIIFQESAKPNSSLYDSICATPFERRNTEQIQKNPQKIQIKITKFTTIIPKRYLYFEIALQIFSNHESFFFCFRKKKNRQKILKYYSNLKGVCSSDKHLKNNVQIQTERWLKGCISNFTYLMHLNDLSGRSFNDISQYYVFPWTVKSFKEKKIDKKFLQSNQNFRDLSKPMGEINKERFDSIAKKYNESQLYSEIQPFLYGSFYSNPAIVCNYLVRLEPFSFHHFHLQTKFDLADRLFHGIEDQYSSCTKNLSDYKELIPQFYFCSEFLRNRSVYDFGYRQNKQLVHNVTLPSWVKNQSAEEFIQKMRRCLESKVITQKLPQWIDLIFGIYNSKERGIEKNNLFLSHIYKNELNKIQNKKQRESCLVFYKQFGQVPRCLFEKNHPSMSRIVSSEKMGEKKPETIHSKQKKTEIFINNQYLLYFENSNNELVLCNGINNLFCDKKKQNIEISWINIVNFEQMGKSHNILMFIRDGLICMHQISESMILRKLELKQELSHTLTQNHPQILLIYQETNMIIVIQGSYVYFYLIQQQNRDSCAGLISLSRRKTIFLYQKTQFTQHRSSITHAQVCQSLGLLVTLDSSRKLFILKIYGEIEVNRCFRLVKLSHFQTVKTIKVHQMCFILVLTNLSYIYVYNFMGQLLCHLPPASIPYLEPHEQICSLEIWNHQSTQIILGTVQGKIIKINWFQPESQFKQCTRISKQPITNLLIDRIGHHWRIYINTTTELKKLQSKYYGQSYKDRQHWQKKIILQ